MNDNIHQIVNDSIVGIVANMDRFFQYGELAFLSYFGKAKWQELGKQNEIEKIEDYWKNKVFSNVSIKGSNGSSWKRVEIDLGNYFNHSSFWKPLYGVL